MWGIALLGILVLASRRMGALGALANLAEPSWSNQRSYTQFRRLPVASAVSFFYHRSVCGVVLPSDRRWLNRELALSWPKSGNAILEQSRRVLQLFLPRSAILDDDDFASHRFVEPAR